MHMLNTAFCILVGSLLACELGQAGLLKSTSPQKNYDKLNSYLIKNVKNSQLGDNMVSAVRWLEELESKQTGCFGSCDKSLIEAVRQFVGLTTTLNLEQCNQAAYEVLKANHEAVGKPSLWYYIKYSNDRRVNYIVRQYAKTHSEMCCKIYPDLVDTRMSNELHPSTKTYITNLAEFLPVPWDHEKMIEEKQYVQILIDFLQKDPEDKQKAAAMVDGTDYEKRKPRLYDFIQYVLTPCKEFNKKISSEFLRATEFDITLQGRDMELYNAGPGKQRDFLKIRSAMHICKRVVEKDRAIWDYITELVGVENISGHGSSSESSGQPGGYIYDTGSSYASVTDFAM